MSRYRLFILGRRGFGPEAMDFYHWLAMSLGQSGPPPVDQLQIPMLPEPSAPDLETWVRAVHEMVGTDPAERARTILVGHSVGAMAAVRFAAALPAGSPLGGLLAVGAWWSVDAPDAVIQPWMDAPLDLAAARANLPRVITVLSDDDPYTADHAANGALWAQRLGAEVRLVPGAGHFHHPVQPEVLRALKDLLGMD